jgi:transcriptional regulator with XRE-family HTH domain
MVMITLREARKNARFSLRQVAQEIGVSVPSISKYETGQQAIDPDALLLMCNLFDVSTIDLKLRQIGTKIYAHPHSPVLAIADNDVEDRVCMHYVIDRVEDILKEHDPQSPEIADLKYMHTRLEEFKRELIYNLGVNQRIKNNGQS